MRKILAIVTLAVLLQGCSIPLVGSLTSSTVTGVATGNYQRSLVSGGIDLAVHKSTGKTPSQHLYAMVENKYTEKRLKKHFPNKEFKVKDFKLSVFHNNTVAPTLASLQKTDYKAIVEKIDYQYFHYN